MTEPIRDDYDDLKAELDRERAEVARLTAERDKLQAFKDWTHAYLDQHGSITRLQAASELGIMNLWQRISEIEPTYPIRREDNVKVPDRRGKICHVTRYWKAQQFAAPQVVHSLPTPSLVGAGAASYKPWLR